MQEVSFLVLDEADRMLDQGFEDTMRAIVGGIRSDRQTLMFSATWPPSVQKLALEFLVNPVKVTIGAQVLIIFHCPCYRLLFFVAENLHRRKAR